jgi:hypothetical protein
VTGNKTLKKDKVCSLLRMEQNTKVRSNKIAWLIV